MEYSQKLNTFYLVLRSVPQHQQSKMNKLDILVHVATSGCDKNHTNPSNRYQEVRHSVKITRDQVLHNQQLKTIELLKQELALYDREMADIHQKRIEGIEVYKQLIAEVKIVNKKVMDARAELNTQRQQFREIQEMLTKERMELESVQKEEAEMKDVQYELQRLRFILKNNEHVLYEYSANRRMLDLHCDLAEHIYSTCDKCTKK